MQLLRQSRPEDNPALRKLWALAFGDSGPYVDNFFHRYYRPERMLVLELDSQVRAMTAWFDTTLILPDSGKFSAAYLYAVATHPDFRSRGFSGTLLAWADEYFRSLKIPVVTTVPARPDLHKFFAQNGFQECFTHDELICESDTSVAISDCALSSQTPAEYSQLRESLLAGSSHIQFPLDALEYQQGCCQVSGGGLYRVDTPTGPAALCAEGMETGQLLVKELIASPSVLSLLPSGLSSLLPNFSGIYRTPGNSVAFGMIKWLFPINPPPKNAYLGLAFD